MQKSRLLYGIRYCSDTQTDKLCLHPLGFYLFFTILYLYSVVSTWKISAHYSLPTPRARRQGNKRIDTHVSRRGRTTNNYLFRRKSYTPSTNFCNLTCATAAAHLPLCLLFGTKRRKRKSNGSYQTDFIQWALIPFTPPIFYWQTCDYCRATKHVWGAKGVDFN